MCGFSVYLTKSFDFSYSWIGMPSQILNMLNEHYMNLENLYFSHKASVSKLFSGYRL